jgi:hypothetical protein
VGGSLGMCLSELRLPKVQLHPRLGFSADSKRACKHKVALASAVGQTSVNQHISHDLLVEHQVPHTARLVLDSKVPSS